MSDTLRVNREVVPGTWSQVRSGGSIWVGQRTDGSWWLGTGTEAKPLPADVKDATPSAGGTLLAYSIARADGTGTYGVRTPEGHIMREQAIELPDPDSGQEPDRIGDVNDDGFAVVERHDTSPFVWDLNTGRTIDLARSAPSLRFAGATPAGLRWIRDGKAFLGYLDAEDGVTPTFELATANGWLNPDGSSSATLGSDHVVVSKPDGTDPVRLDSPEGWKIHDLLWETDQLFVLRLTESSDEVTGLARCSIERAACIEISPDEELADAGKPPPQVEIPYVFDGLYVDGQLVPGEWDGVESGGKTWVGHHSTSERTEISWGIGTEVHPLPDALWAGVSPDGARVAWTEETGRLRAVVHVLETATGKTLPRTLEVALPAEGDRTEPVDPAFTDDGRLFLSGEEGAALWDPVTGQKQEIRAEGGFDLTPDGSRWVRYPGVRRVLARLEPDGTFTDEHDLPLPEGLAGPAGEWAIQQDRLMSVGDIGAAEAFLVARVDSGKKQTLEPPTGWLFDEWHWITADTFLADLVDEEGRPGLARCDLNELRCTLLRH